MEATIALIDLPSTRTWLRLTLRHPSFAPPHTLYTPSAELEMLAKPMKSKEFPKHTKHERCCPHFEHKNDIKTRFINGAMTKLAFRSNPCTEKGLAFRNVLLAYARTTFRQPEAHQTCRSKVADLPRCMQCLTHRKVQLIKLALLRFYLLARLSILCRDFHMFSQLTVRCYCRNTLHTSSGCNRASSLHSRKCRPRSSHSHFFSP